MTCSHSCCNHSSFITGPQCFEDQLIPLIDSVEQSDGAAMEKQIASLTNKIQLLGGMISRLLEVCPDDATIRYERVAYFPKSFGWLCLASPLNSCLSLCMRLSVEMNPRGWAKHHMAISSHITAHCKQLDSQLHRHESSDQLTSRRPHCGRLPVGGHIAVDYQ